MIDWLIFGFIYVISLNWALSRKDPGAVVIGVPDPENKKMFWLAKPEKTAWQEFRGNLPPFFLGVLVGGLVVCAIFLVAL